MTAPLILTGAFVAADQQRFDRLRTAHFPAELNHIPAHLTLFHHLPGEEEASIDMALRLLATLQGPCTAAVTGLRSLGRGVAYTLECPPLAKLRAAMLRDYHDALTAQDRQGWRPHVTVQNKVAPAEAAALLAQMQAGFTPFEVKVKGVSLWRYEGGPWSLVHSYRFAGPP